MLAPDPLGSVEQWASRTTAIIGAAALIWALMRVAVRPLFDDLTFAAWKRKRAEAERFMREEIFKGDIEQRRLQEQQLQQALSVAHQNGQSISHLASDIAKLGAEQHAMTTLLAGIPLLAAGIEAVNDTLEHLRRDIQANTETTQEHGERIAALSALQGIDGRRHHTRRASDPHLIDHDPDDLPEPDR